MLIKLNRITVLICLWTLPSVGAAAPSAVKEMDVDNDGGASAVLSSDENVRIYKPQTGTVEEIPETTTLAWPTWVLYADGIVRIPNADDGGYKNPVSGEDLYQPVDLIEPELRPALGFHIREGMIRHVMPAVDLSFERKYHNRGLASVPRARQWMDFANVDWNDYGMILLRRKLNTKSSDDDDDEESSALEVMSELLPVKPFVDRAVQFLTSDGPPDAWKDGSHIVHIVLDDDSSPVSKKIVEESGGASIVKVGHELMLLLNQDTGMMRGQLKVKVTATAAGSSSTFLPEVYKDLFSNEAYQRKTYFDFMKRKEAKREKQKKDAAESVRKAREEKAAQGDQ